MKKIRIEILLFLLLFGCSSNSLEDKKVEENQRVWAEPPEEKPFVNIEKLTPEARLTISAAISRKISSMDQEGLKQYARQQLLRGDVDNNGLSLSDLEYSERQQDARRKTRNLSDVFQADQNGDGEVSEKEFKFYADVAKARQSKQKAEYLKRNPDKPYRGGDAAERQILELNTKFMNADANDDKIVTLKEAYLAPYELPRAFGNRKNRAFDKASPLDFNDDGLITPKEVDAATDLFLLEAATLGLEILSDGRQQNIEAKSAQLAGLGKTNQCDFPKPTAKAQIIRISGYEGNQLSSVALAGQDEETTTSEIRIDPGSQPLYIVASTYESHIWRFTGAVKRVEHAVLSSRRKDLFGQSGVGQTGLPKKRSSVSNANCVGKDSKKIAKEQQGQPMTLTPAFGARTGKHYYFYSQSGISLPSGSEYKLPVVRPDNLKATDRSDVELAWRSFVRFMPSGVFGFRPQDVVTSSRVEKYKVLPHQAGITQLLVSGILEKSKWGGFIVRKPMRYPASLGGSHSEIFIVPKGAPRPTGSPGHSCVRESERPPNTDSSGRRC